MKPRSLSSIPKTLIIFVFVSLSIQVVWHSSQPETQANAQDLIISPDVSILRVLSFGDPVPLAKVLMLWLQGFDNQPGISIPFIDLDYGNVESWLASILTLDPKGQYPLLAASRVYSHVPDEAKQRQMLEFIYKQYLIDPARRWPWLAHAAIVAKHKLKDLPLALKYSGAIADKSSSNAVPSWARQMQLVILEEMGELEAAQFLIGGLLKTGTITDQKEINFLNQNLQRLKNNSVKSIN